MTPPLSSNMRSRLVAERPPTNSAQAAQSERVARSQRLAAVALIAFVLGLLVVIQVRSQDEVSRSLADQDNTSIALLIDELNQANNQLLQQGAALRQRQATLEQGLRSGSAGARALEKEVSVLKAVAGSLAVRGPGLDIHIGGPVQDFEIEDTLNNLRNAGAEAFALNGVRLIDSTAIESRGDRLLVDGKPLQAPYALQVIGDPERLEQAAEVSTSSLQTRVPVSVDRLTMLTITAVRPARPLIYAQLGR